MSRGRKETRGQFVRRMARQKYRLTDKDTANNRRKLLKKLKPDVAEFAAIEFAKLGLYQ